MQSICDFAIDMSALCVPKNFLGPPGRTWGPSRRTWAVFTQVLLEGPQVLLGGPEKIRNTTNLSTTESIFNTPPPHFHLSNKCLSKCGGQLKYTPTVRAQTFIFWAKISRLFHFQIVKWARLKTVIETKALTFAMPFYDQFRALNAKFFYHHRFLSIADFSLILKLARFKAVTKSPFFLLPNLW